MVTQTYFDFAENDYRFFVKSYEFGNKGSALAALGQSICERYLKHLITQYALPESKAESYEKEAILRTHSLRKLMDYLENDMHLSLQNKDKDALRKIDGYYFTTRYPGEESFLATTEDVDQAYDAICRTRQLVITMSNELTSSDLEQDEEELERE